MKRERTPLFSVTKLGSQLSATRIGDVIYVGITNTLAHAGVAQIITLAEARRMGEALIAAGEPS